MKLEAPDSPPRRANQESSQEAKEVDLRERLTDSRTRQEAEREDTELARKSPLSSNNSGSIIIDDYADSNFDSSSHRCPSEAAMAVNEFERI